jgi:hypothetical protein
MTTMITAASRAFGAGCVLLAVGMLSGCMRTVDGAATGSAGHGGPPPTLAQLLIEPQRFPSGYSAAVLDAASTEAAVRDIDGVPAGAAVDPPQCAPPPPGRAPTDVVAVRGVDAATAASVTVTLARTPDGLGARRDQVAGCPAFTVTRADAVTRIEATELPAAPVDADGGFAVSHTVTDPAGSTTSTLTLVAQIGDVRVTAARMSPDDDPTAHTDALDSLFTDAVLKVRRDGTP